MEENPIKKENNGRDPITGRFIEGYAGGPGRPKFSLTEEQKKFFLENPEEFKNFLSKMRNKEDFWKKLWDKTDADAAQEKIIKGDPNFPVNIIIK